MGMRRSSRGKLYGAIPINTGGLSAGGLLAIKFGVGGSNGSPDVLYSANEINSGDGRAVRRDNRPLGPAARRAGRPLGGCLWPIGRSAAAPIAQGLRTRYR
jgi:hypothetical protein